MMRSYNHGMEAAIAWWPAKDERRITSQRDGGVWLTRKHDHAIRRKHDCCRIVEAMHRLRVGNDTPTVAGHRGIDPLFIDIAVEDLTPGSTARESKAIPDAGEVGQMQHHDDVMAFPFYPAMKRQHAVLIMHVRHAIPPPALSWKSAA